MGLLPDDFQKRIKLFRDAGLEEQYGQYNNKSEQTQALKDYLRGTSGGTSTSSPQAPNVTELYNKFYNTPELTALTDSINQIKDQINQRQEQANQAETKVNDNPFYSEATRVGKVRKVQEAFSRDINTLTNRANTAIGQAQEMRANAETQLNLALKQYDINNQEYQRNLTMFNTLLQNGGLNNASSAELASFAKATGISTSAIKSMVEASNRPEISPQIITSTDDYGNLTITTVDKNTGQVIAQTGAGQIEKTKSSGGSGSLSKSDVTQTITQRLSEYAGQDGKVSPETYTATRNIWNDAGFSYEEFDKLFAKRFVNPKYPNGYQLTDPSLVAN